jgi:trimeric autotransporter adhesin
LSVRSSHQHIVPVIVLLILCSSALISLGSALTISPETQLSFTEVAKGDPVTIHGTTTGRPASGLMLWIIGNNYVRTFTVPVNGDNTYLSSVKSDDTAKMASGQYLVLVQNPGVNGRFDIIYNSNSGSVVNLQPAWIEVTYKANPNALGPTEEGTYKPVEDTVLNFQRDGGTTIYELTNAGAGAGLVDVLNNQNVDDTFASTSFAVVNPVALISPIPNHAVGDRFTIVGKTNLAAGDPLNVEIRSSTFAPATKLQNGGFSGSSGRVPVLSGPGGNNCWTYTVDASGYPPGEYSVKVSGVLQDVTGSAAFTIQNHLTATVTSNLPVTSAQSETTAPGENPAALPTTQTSPLLPVVVAGGLGLALLLTRHRRSG